MKKIVVLLIMVVLVFVTGASYKSVQAKKKKPKISFSASPAVLNRRYGTVAHLSGHLFLLGGKDISNARIYFQRSSNGSNGWSNFDNANRTTNSNGRYDYRFQPEETFWYRAKYYGNSKYDSVISEKAKIEVQN